MDQKRIRRIAVFLVIVGVCLMAIGAILVYITVSNEGLFDSTGALKPNVELGGGLLSLGMVVIMTTVLVYVLIIAIRADKYKRSS